MPAHKSTQEPEGKMEKDLNHESPEANFKAVQRSFSFWAIIVGLGITLLLSALENTVLTTAAPVILAEIPLHDNWIWLTNAFFLASAAFQPLLSQLANLCGRRWITMSVIALFMLGSGVCGGATDGATLIAGRTIQGLGSGGILQAFDTIVSDLVPLRYRGNYVAIILLIYSIGATMGAFIGGIIVDHISWRWVFYINLPVGTVSLLIMFFFLNVHYHSDLPLIARLKRIDFIGNGLLIGGSTSMLIALTYAGTRHPWSSWATLLPLLLGFSTLLLFALFESSRLAPRDPVMPPRLFANRTSLLVATHTFLFYIAIYWAIFFLPVYFQAVKLTSPTRAGINMIPVALLGVPSAAAAAAALSRWGKYKAIHILGFALSTAGLALFAQLDEHSPTAEWVGYMFVSPLAGGLLLNTQLPAFQAPVPERDQGAATGCWNFIKTLGSVWGVAIPAAIFANRIDGLVAGGAVSNPVAARMMVGGGAYQYASAAFVKGFAVQDQAEIVAVYRMAVQRVFLVAIAFSGLACLVCLFESDVVLRVDLVTEYGLKEGGEVKAGTKAELKPEVDTV